MKAKWFLISVFAWFTGLALISCSSDDDSIVPEFPEKGDIIEVNANEIKELSFKANMNWTIAANKTWITFLDDEDELGTSTQGSSSIEIISQKIKVKDTGWGFDDDIAEIKLIMGDKEEVIFEIKRLGKPRVVKMFEIKNMSGIAEEVSKIDLTFLGENSSTTQIGFIANYDWELILPDCAELSGVETLNDLAATDLNGVPKSEKIVFIYIKSEFITSALTEEIGIKDINNDFIYKFPLNYTGMGEENLIFITNNRFNRFSGIEFSQDGYFIEKKGSYETVTSDKEISFSVRSKDMKFSSYLIQMNESNQPEVVQSTNLWAKIQETETKGDFNVSISGNGINSGAPRTLYFLALPEKLAAAPNFSDYFINGAVNPETGGNYIIKISQKGEVAAGGFTMAWGIRGAIEQMEISDMGDMVGAIGHGAPANNTYSFGFTDEIANGAGALQIFPIGWQFTEGGSFQVVSLADGGGDWSAASHEIVTIDEGLTFGVSLSNLEEVAGVAVILFYNSLADQEAEKPMGAMLLMKD